MIDPETYNIDSQFLWGSSLMIVPVLDEVKEQFLKIEIFLDEYLDF